MCVLAIHVQCVYCSHSVYVVASVCVVSVLCVCCMNTVFLLYLCCLSVVAMDVSADLTELGRTAVTVISSGVKSILDIKKTLEYLVSY